MRGFESMACGFLLLTWTDTIRLWAKMYYWLHFTMFVTIVFAKVKLLIAESPKKISHSHNSTGENAERKPSVVNSL